MDFLTAIADSGWPVFQDKLYGPSRGLPADDGLFKLRGPSHREGGSAPVSTRPTEAGEVPGLQPTTAGLQRKGVLVNADQVVYPGCNALEEIACHVAMTIEP